MLLGPSGAPAAVGPTDNNDDYTNKSSNPGNIAPGSHHNRRGSAACTSTRCRTPATRTTRYTIDAPTVPAGFTVELSTDGGYNLRVSATSLMAVAFGSSANINVRVTVPAGKTVLTGL